jgi:hypothetical protein
LLFVGQENIGYNPYAQNKVSGSAFGNSGPAMASGTVQSFCRGSVLSTTNAQLQDAGLHLKQGDTQKEGAKLDPSIN